MPLDELESILAVTRQLTAQVVAAEADAARMFAPCFATRRRFCSTGLGMHMVYNMVTLQLNGTIKIDSHAGGGFHCTVSMPAASPSSEHPGYQQSAV